MARSTRGLEWVVAAEASGAESRVDGLTARQVRLDVGVLAEAPELRTADDVFVPVGTVRADGRGRSVVPAIASAVAGLDVTGAVATVRSVRDVPRRPVLDVVASLDGDRRFSRFDVEDAVGAAIAPMLQATHASRRHGRPPPADLSLRVALADDRAEVLLRLGAAPLHRRPWKVATGPGTLHPPVAAALLRLAGAPGPVLDPFCGDGTVVVEGALGGWTVVGADLDPERLAHARANAAAAGVPARLVRADAGTPWWSAPGGTWITNPPWAGQVAAGGRVGHGAAGGRVGDSLGAAWQLARRALGTTGCVVAVTDVDLAAGDGLARDGWALHLVQPLRLAGRPCEILVATGPDRPSPISPSLASWRERAEDLRRS